MFYTDGNNFSFGGILLCICFLFSSCSGNDKSVNSSNFFLYRFRSFNCYRLLQDGLTPLEIVGMHSNLAGVMILFPVTSRIPTIPNWSLDGIMKHLHSEEGRRQVMMMMMTWMNLSSFLKVHETTSLKVSVTRLISLLQYFEKTFTILCCLDFPLVWF